MTVTCEINLPEKIIRALGVTEREAGSVMKKELAAYFFSERDVDLWSGKTARRIVCLGFP